MAESAAATRPRAVRYIAWAWILTGVINGLGAAVGWLSAGLLQGLESGGALTPHSAAALGLAGAPAGHAFWPALGQLALAVLAVAAGIDFLRLRRWARSALEALCWLSIVYLGIGIVHWWRFWDAFAASGSVGGITVDLAPYRTSGLIIGSACIAALAVPLGVMIRVLRGRTVREALAGAAPQRKE